VKKLILAAAAIAAIGLPSIAVAQTMPGSGSMICRAPKTGETGNAIMGGNQMMCRPMNMKRVNAAMKVMMDQKGGNDHMKRMQDAQNDLYDEFGLPAVPGGINNAESGN
jgi:hypothetical protein